MLIGFIFCCPSNCLAKDLRVPKQNTNTNKKTTNTPALRLTSQYQSPLTPSHFAQNNQRTRPSSPIDKPLPLVSANGKAISTQLGQQQTGNACGRFKRTLADALIRVMYNYIYTSKRSRITNTELIQGLFHTFVTIQ